MLRIGRVSGYVKTLSMAASSTTQPVHAILDKLPTSPCVIRQRLWGTFENVPVSHHGRVDSTRQSGTFSNVRTADSRTLN